MPVGLHMFYARFPYDVNTSRIDYYLGGFKGDPFNDEEFKLKLEKVQKKLDAKLGFLNYISVWAPVFTKEYKPRTAEQRFNTAIVKATNKSNRKIEAFKKQNLLFQDEFIAEENQKLIARKQVLKKRYNQLDIKNKL